eukprot:4341330-Amphidinium_carterae.2
MGMRPQQLSRGSVLAQIDGAMSGQVAAGWATAQNSLLIPNHACSLPCRVLVCVAMENRIKETF